MSSIAYKHGLYLLGFIIFLFFLNAYNLTYNIRPAIHHQWRQTDCLSIAKNYYEEGMNFLQPSIHSRLAVDGKVVSEMPVLNYAAALLWKMFGESEGLYRFMEYLIFVSAILFLFASILREGFSFFLAFLAVSVPLSSPLLTYYGFNFLPDVPALSLAIISFCLLRRATREGSKTAFFFCIVTGLLAALMKASAVFPLLMTGFMAIIQLAGMNKRCALAPLPGNLFFNLILIVCSFASIVSWYAYARSYSQVPAGGIFLTELLPVWNMKEETIYDNLSFTFTELFPVFHNRVVLSGLLLLLVIALLNLSKMETFFRYSLVLSLVFSIAYVLFFLQALNAHDYYLINLFIVPVILLWGVMGIYSKRVEECLAPRKWRLVLFLFVMVNSLYSASHYRMLTIKDDKLCYWFPFISHRDTGYRDWQKWDYNLTWGGLHDIEGDHRKMGIKRTDLFMVVPDGSPNISLYFIDQKGYALDRVIFLQDTMWKKGQGFYKCSYFMLFDTVLKRSNSFKATLPNMDLVFSRGPVELYKIRKN